MDVTINVCICFHANVVFVQPTDISSHGESGNVNALSTHFKKTTRDNSSIKKNLLKWRQIWNQNAHLVHVTNVMKLAWVSFGKSTTSLASIPAMLGRSIFSQFWSIFCNDESLDFKCDIHSIMRSLPCNERVFLRIIDHILIKIDLKLIPVGAKHKLS